MSGEHRPLAEFCFSVRMHSKFFGVWFYLVYSMYAVHAHVCFICCPFRIRRLELTPDRCCHKRVYVRACTSTLAPEPWFFHGFTILGVSAPLTLHAGFKHLQSIPLRTPVSYSSCSPDKPASISPKPLLIHASHRGTAFADSRTFSRNSNGFIFHHGVPGGAHVWLSRDPT